MQNPPNSVINRLRLGKRLVTTLMRDNPQTRRDEARPKSVDRPEGEMEEWIKEKSREELSGLLVAAEDIIKTRETGAYFPSTDPLLFY